MHGFPLAPYEMTLLFFISVCMQPSFSKCSPGEGEARGGWCPTDPRGFTRLYQLHPTDPRKGTAVMNYWITPPHCHMQILYIQAVIYFHTQTVFFENPKYTSTSLDLNVERCDSLTVRCLSVFLYSFFLRSAFCQWFCSLSFTRGD